MAVKGDKIDLFPMSLVGKFHSSSRPLEKEKETYETTRVK